MLMLKLIQCIKLDLCSLPNFVRHFSDFFGIYICVTFIYLIMLVSSWITIALILELSTHINISYVMFPILCLPL